MLRKLHFHGLRCCLTADRKRPVNPSALDAALRLPYLDPCQPSLRKEKPLADKSLDARNLNCPLPILKATKALKDVRVGGTLEVLATDPGSPGDFEAFCRVGRHEMVEESHTGGVFRFLIRRGR